MIESAICPRCEEGVEDTEHRWWNCPAFEDIRREQYVKSITREWEREGGNLPGCFTHCGIVNEEMLKMTWSEAMKGVDRRQQVEKMTCTKAWTDGSGSHSKDVIKRRAGWGVVFSNGAKKGGPLQGINQTVYRAELRAVVEALESTRGSIQIITDCRSVHDGMKGGDRKGDIDLSRG